MVYCCIFHSIHSFGSHQLCPLRPVSVVCVCVCVCVCVLCLNHMCDGVIHCLFANIMTGLGYNAGALGFFMTLIIILIIAAIVVAIAFIVYKRYKWVDEESGFGVEGERVNGKEDGNELLLLQSLYSEHNVIRWKLTMTRKRRQWPETKWFSSTLP